jgi:hypothetical protein
MAGFREFVTGEVLTAANVDDFLAKQSVMKFADAAARDAALGTAVAGGNALREGMASYLDSTDAFEIYDGTAWGAIGAAGIGSNVVQAVKTTTFATSSSTFVDIDDLAVTITPSDASSKVLVLATVNFSNSNDADGNAGHIRLLAGASPVFVGDAASNRTQASATTGEQVIASYRNGGSQASAGLVFLHSPATASPVTYKVQGRRGTNGSMFVNRSGFDGDFATQARTVSSITVIEVAP